MCGIRLVMYERFTGVRRISLYRCFEVGTGILYNLGKFVGKSCAESGF